MKNRVNIFTGFLFFLLLGTPALTAQTGQTTGQQNQTQQEEITDEELQNFARAFRDLRSINEDAQEEMAQVVRDEGMEIQRFNQIFQAKNDPQTQFDISEEEEKKYQRITSQLDEMQTSYQSEKEQAITEEDLTVERFEQIGRQLENDPELQERFAEIYQEQGIDRGGN